MSHQLLNCWHVGHIIDRLLTDARQSPCTATQQSGLEDRLVSDESAESRVEVLQTSQHLSKPRSLVRIERPATGRDGKPTITPEKLYTVSQKSMPLDV